MPDAFDEIARVSDQVEAAARHDQQRALASAQHEAGGRVFGTLMGGEKVSNFFEFLLLFLILIGVAIAALVWQLFFGDDEPSHSEVPGVEHHDDSTEVPTFGLGYVIVVPAKGIDGA